MTRSMWIYIFVCAALGLTYFVMRKDRVRVGMRELNLPQIAVSSIDKIEIQGTERVQLIKADDSWWVYLGEPENKKALASAEYVAALFKAAPHIQSAYFATERLDQQGKFHVSDDKAIKVVLYSADRPAWTLLVGDEAQGGGRYVRVPATLPIFVAKGQFGDLTRSLIDEWRNRIILPVAKDKLVKLIIKKSGTEETISSEKMQMHPLVEVLTNLRALRFVDSNEDKILAQQELKSPLFEITIYDKNNSFYELVVATNKEQQKTWVWLRGGNQIYEISQYMLERLSLVLTGSV